MEVLSTGEKIKRARVYKGITLKDICGDKISVSKMSCIENNKIKPEPWILEFIADKLDLSMNYLQQDVRQQIKENINGLKNSEFSHEVEADFKYNLEYALEFSEFDLAFEITHILFDWYLEKEKFLEIEDLISEYYEICEKCDKGSCYMIYYADIAAYFECNEEYIQAISCYESAINIMDDSKIEDLSKRCIIEYNKFICYSMMENYEKINSYREDLNELLNKIKDDTLRAHICSIISMLELRFGDENKAYDLQDEIMKLYGNNEKKIISRLIFANTLVDLGRCNEAIEYLEDTANMCYNDFNNMIGKTLIFEVKNLLKMNDLDRARERCSEVLNYAISNDNMKLMEKAYYFKAVILKEKGMNIEAEMYMNLSLDALIKFGSKKELYKRYMDMGNMYYDFSQTRDAIRYFSLAINLEKAI